MARLLWLVVGIIGLATSGAAAATLVPLSHNPGGQSPEVSAEQWFKWTLSFDRVADGGDPLTDATGDMQGRKQVFPVHMLGGTLGGDARRTFTTTPHKPFMIPLVNSFCIGGLTSPPNDASAPCGAPDRKFARDTQDSVDRLFLKIDGKVLLNADTAGEVDALEHKFRIETDIFPVDVAANNFLTEFANVPKGRYPTALTNGFYAFAKLDPGMHRIRYIGATPDFSTSVRARINVVPIPAALPLLVTALACLGLATRRLRMTA